MTLQFSDVSQCCCSSVESQGLRFFAFKVFLLGTSRALLQKEKSPSMLSDMLRIVRSHQLPVSTAPAEPLLCKFADGGQKKRQNPNKYIPNGRPWHREGEVRLVSPFLKLECGFAILNTHGKPALQGHLDWPAALLKQSRLNLPGGALSRKGCRTAAVSGAGVLSVPSPGGQVEMGRATLRFGKAMTVKGLRVEAQLSQ